MPDILWCAKYVTLAASLSTCGQLLTCLQREAATVPIASLRHRRQSYDSVLTQLLLQIRKHFAAAFLRIEILFQTPQRHADYIAMMQARAEILR